MRVTPYMLLQFIKIKLGKNLLAKKCTVGRQNARNRCIDVPKTGKRVFSEKVLPNSGHPTEGFRRNRHIDVPKTGKRVFPKKVLPNLAHPTEGFRRNRHIDVPKTGKRVFPKKVLPNLAHPTIH
jgi:hypothetical protein